jgi:hypothetical protein
LQGGKYISVATRNAKAAVTGIGWFRVILAGALAGTLAACANTAAYRPASSEGVSGYRETAMDNGHYLVSFTGTISMGLDEVKNYARRRAAEVTLREGYSHFVIFSARSEADIRVVPNGDYWNPDNGFRAGYITKDSSRERTRETGQPLKPWVGDSGKRTRYTAFTEIAMLGADEVTRFPDAMAAKDVLEETAPPSR